MVLSTTTTQLPLWLSSRTCFQNLALSEPPLQSGFAGCMCMCALSSTPKSLTDKGVCVCGTDSLCALRSHTHSPPRSCVYDRESSVHVDHCLSVCACDSPACRGARSLHLFSRVCPAETQLNVSPWCLSMLLFQLCLCERHFRHPRSLVVLPSAV